MSSSQSQVLRRLNTEDIGKELDGVIVTAVKLIFERNGFVIFACKGGFTVKGTIPGSIVEGVDYKISGTVTTYNEQMQISAAFIEAVDDEDTDKAQIAAFLKDTFDGVGEKTAKRLAETYGDEVLEAIVNDPDSVASEVSGITAEKASEVADMLQEDPVYYHTLLKLRKLGLSAVKSRKIYDSFGDECIDRISSNPYILMHIAGIGFDTCEFIAKKLNTEPLSISRFEGAIVSVTGSLHEETGDTFLAPAVVRNRTASLLSKDTGGSIPEQIFEGLYTDAIERAVADRFIIVYRFVDGKCAGCSESDEGARISSRTYFGTELTIKKEIESFLNARKVIPDEKKMRKKIRDMGDQRGIELDKKQEDALYMSMYSPLSIITGGPGTGKTTITSILAQHFREKGIECEFCAPTGRAAKRLSEAAGVKACTIHRLLEMSAPSDDEDEVQETFFGRNKSNPLECRVVVADEASMIDIFLFKALLDALPSGSSLILVGDPEQLPAVGAGNVLADLISCPSIPCVRLEYVFRQDEESSIASNAVRILNGQAPVAGEDFEIISVPSDEEALGYIRRLSEDNKDSDHAILCPTRRNTLGTENLNLLLQRSHNDEAQEPSNIRADLKLYPGDNVMQIKNNYSIEYYDPSSGEVQRGVFNGEMGKFKGFDVLTGKYDIIFDGDRKIGYDKKKMADIELSYAVTVHKAQGCEFDKVTIALGKMNYKLSNRKLLYTAVTRGRNKVTIVDSSGRLGKMLASDTDVSRNTSLKDFLTIVAGRHEDGIA